MESHRNENEVAVGDPFDPGLPSRTYLRRRKSRKHRKFSTENARIRDNYYGPEIRLWVVARQWLLRPILDG